MPSTNSVFKCAVCGEEGVGKSSLIMQYTEEKFSEQYIHTMGSNFAQTDILLEDGDTVKLQLWDLAGQTAFAFVRPQFYIGARATILVYDLTMRNSFDSLPWWKAEAEENAHERMKFFLFGNKSDLESGREISTEEGEKMAKKLGVLQFWETSAKTGENVREAFYSIAESLFTTSI